MDMKMTMPRRAGLVAAATMLIAAVSSTPASAAPILLAMSGANAADILFTVDAFRLALGGGTTPGPNGSFGGVRREINWDGVPNAAAAPNQLPANFFNVNSPRGVVFSTPGTGFEVSATAASGQPIEFNDLNPTYSSQFATFSPERLFTALGSNIVDVSFFLPGTTTAALTRGFGSVFTDVDPLNTPPGSSTSIQYFDASNNSLGTFLVPSFVGNETLSFLGVIFDAPIVSRVRLTAGNQALGAGTTGDVVAMDDFIFGEPTAAVPEPATLGLMGIGVFALMAARRRSHRTT
jgi:hypothetical protein